MLSHFSHVRLFAILWTVACQTPLSMAFSRQEYWSGLPCPPPGDLPDPGTEPLSLVSPAAAGSLPLVPPGKRCLQGVEGDTNLRNKLIYNMLYGDKVTIKPTRERGRAFPRLGCYVSPSYLFFWGAI